MDKQWVRLTILAIVIMLVLVGWDVFLLVSGAKDEFQYNIAPISDQLFGPVEEHFRAHADFADFEQEALREQ